MRTVIDLGLQKTGSKARQRFFTDHLHRVRCVRPLYPTTGRQASWHRPLYDSLRKREFSVVEALSREIAEHCDRADVIILSYEELHKLELPQIEWLRDALPKLAVVICLRRQDQLVNSLHNQFHKSHRVSLRQLESFESGMLAYDPFHDYRLILERWSSAIGRENVFPHVFTKGNSSVGSFFQQVGVDVDLNGYEETYPNRAMNPAGLAVLRWIKRLTTDDLELPAIMNQAHIALAEHVMNGDETGYTLTVEQRLHLMSQYEASNDWVRREFFPKSASLFEPLERGHLTPPDYSSGREAAEAIITDARKAQNLGR